MEVTAKQSYVRGSVQKLTDVTRVVKNMKVTAMRTQLSQMNKDAARRILETLNQAVANAQHNFGISEDKLVLKELLILRGPHYKRMRPVSRGQGHAILKRTSHIFIKLASMEETKAVETKPDVAKAMTGKETSKPVVKKIVTKKKAK
jgi:large subunit ribosomal protein L22